MRGRIIATLLIAIFMMSLFTIFVYTAEGFTGNLTVVDPPKPAEFIWANFSYTSEVQEGEPLEVHIDIINIGEVAGHTVETVYIDGVGVFMMDVDLEPGGEIGKHWISLHPYEVGSYTVQLGGFAGVFKVIPKPIPFWERPELAPVIILGVVMFGIGIIYIYFRKTDFSGWT